MRLATPMRRSSRLLGRPMVGKLAPGPLASLEYGVMQMCIVGIGRSAPALPFSNSPIEIHAHFYADSGIRRQSIELA